MVGTCSCLALEQRGELKFVVCSLVEALFEPCAFQASSGLFLLSQVVCVFKETSVGRQDCRETCRAVPRFEVHRTDANAAFHFK